MAFFMVAFDDATGIFELNVVELLPPPRPARSADRGGREPFHIPDAPEVIAAALTAQFGENAPWITEFVAELFIEAAEELRNSEGGEGDDAPSS
jgi:hypothetical protein